jgi:hypothetical protein
MNDFQKLYLSLLRKQVDEEIAYLVRNGHNNDKISVPCIFCVQHQHGYYYCRRLIELRQFQSSIISHGNPALSTLREKPKERRVVGRMAEFPSDSQSLPMSTKLDVGQMPLMSVKL